MTIIKNAKMLNNIVLHNNNKTYKITFLRIRHDNVKSTPTHKLLQGNIKLLLDDIEQLKPTVFPSVPRVLNKLHDKIMEGIREKPTFVQWLIGKATESKLEEVKLIS